jgi:hypothetical protein
LKDPALLEHVTRSWKQAPEHFAQGSESTGISAALWTNRNDASIEVNAEPLEDQHIVCLKFSAFEADY